MCCHHLKGIEGSQQIFVKTEIKDAFVVNYNFLATLFTKGSSNIIVSKSLRLRDYLSKYATKFAETDDELQLIAIKKERLRHRSKQQDKDNLSAAKLLFREMQSRLGGVRGVDHNFFSVFYRLNSEFDHYLDNFQ